MEPLRSNPDFRFWTFPERGAESLEGYVRLGIGGPLISEADEAAGLLVLDGTWRLAQRMEPFFSEIPVRSLPMWQTAYPRVSKVFEDPVVGLATIEAIYAAYVGMRRNTTGLLDQYYWADQFLQKNQHLLVTG